MALIAMGAPSLVRNRRNCAPRQVLLSRKVLAAILKAIVIGLLVGSRPLPMTLFPLMRLSGHSRNQETKWSSVPFAHVPTRFAKDRHRGHDVDAVDPGQVCTGHAKQPFAQVELRLIRSLFLEPPLALLFRQRGALAAILSLLEILRELAITLCDLLLAKLVSLLLLLQNEQQIFLPVALQIARDLLLARLDSTIPKLSQLMRITFASQNGLDDGLSGDTADIAQHVRQLHIHLRQPLLHPQNMSTCTLDEIVALPPVGPHRANLL